MMMSVLFPRGEGDEDWSPSNGHQQGVAVNKVTHASLCSLPFIQGIAFYGRFLICSELVWRTAGAVQVAGACLCLT